jgi:membrane fusion protein (multidrug efflux system)
VSRRRCALILSVSLALAACGGEQQEEAVAAGRPVSLSLVRAVDLSDRIGATGQLLAKQRAEVAAEVGGRISEILIDEGGSVEAGAAVLAIDPERRALERDSARARVDEARASMRDSQREYDRVFELHQRNVASDTQLDQSQTELARARSRVAGAEAQLGMAVRALRDARVTAPFAGLIARRLVSRGEFVAPGAGLFELVSLDPIEVEFHLPEVDSSRVRIDHLVEVRVAPYPDEVFRAAVTLVSPTIDPRTRTLRVKAEMENSNGRLRPGLFARVDLGIATRRGVAMVPEEAVLQRADGAVVFRLIAGDRVERLVIETGTYRDGAIEVVSGLRIGDRIVSKGHSALIDGERVVPRKPDGSAVEAPSSELADAREGAG